ncbi:MAG TPA: carbamoyltransferase HypF [Thermoanaerobaculia bacterium]|nr:carbamoyltransferase HypF [Thermoanaerobaculia bacterium]
MRRVRLEVRGAVQGVGFRPFVWRLAHALSLAGWVRNDIAGVFIELEGEDGALREFRRALDEAPPPLARIREILENPAPVTKEPGFTIRPSEDAGARTVLVLPDVATCPACLAEVLDPKDRRHLYPFANCTNCGPRFTIVTDLPYDRPATTMAAFTLCGECRAEYEDPRDRRFHAQPIACPACGPHLEAWSPSGDVLARRHEALLAAADALRAGAVVAVKGLGGFHLMCDARSADAVAALRRRKRREEKPLALMVRDVAAARALAEVTDESEALLAGPEAPIVLLPRRADAGVASNVAPGRPELGLMLPATPLHHLLLRETRFPVVATSGNRSEEPIATDEREALVRLAGMADLFLVHDRALARHVDDSVARVVAGAPRLLRRARGWAPLPVPVREELPVILGVGAHMKTAVALSVGRQVFLSQHVGDLETPEALDAFERVIADFQRLYAVEPAAVAHDLHPGYASTVFAKKLAEARGLPAVAVQHHHAHLAACLAENEADGPALGVTWDGTGLGTDGTIWGGEFLLGDASGFTRVAHLRPFRLLGGDAAVKEPRRIALAILLELLGEGALGREDLECVRSFSRSEREVLAKMASSGLNAPVTTSAGRLFDAVASLLGIAQKSSFEGQSAMALEAAAFEAWGEVAPGAAQPLAGQIRLVISSDGSAILDWEPLLSYLLRKSSPGVSSSLLAAEFHAALADGIAAAAAHVGAPRVALTGGCFQNKLLTELAAARLRAAGFEVLLHGAVPPNDGGIGLGQVLVAAERLKHLHRGD